MRTFLFILLLFSITAVSAQKDLLAKNYFEQGEYEKALTLYTKLYENSKRYDYFKAIVATHQQLENYTEAEKMLIEKLQAPRVSPQLYVELGHNYALQQKDSLADINYNKAIDYIETNPMYANTIGESFEKYSLLNQAISTYELAMQLNPERDFNYQLAALYGEQGDIEKMFISYLQLIKTNFAYKNLAQRNFSSYITEDPLNEANVILRKILLKKLQENPNVLYNELLSWLFIQQREYKKAFAQEKARIYSAGIETHGLNKNAVAIMKEDGIDISNHTSNHIDEYMDVDFDIQRQVPHCAQGSFAGLEHYFSVAELKQPESMRLVI